MMNRTILVTGAGFIGSHLCRRLLKDGNRVICLDDFRTGSRDHIADLMGDPMFSLLEADVIEPVELDVDQIYHLACAASPVRYREDPVGTAKTCFLGALRMLELADREHARILLTSTSEVYGEPAVHPQPESYRGNVSSIGPRACYDEGKRIAETLFFDFWRTRGTDIRVVRIFNTYGPCMEADDGRIVSNFLSQALRNEDITVYGDGLQTRSFCYVEDMIRGLIRMMALEPREEACGGEEELPEHIGPVNLGNPEERTVLSAAEEILRLTGSASRIVFRDLPKDDPSRRRPDIARAERLLGWKPEIPFSEGIARTAAWFREQARKERP